MLQMQGKDRQWVCFTRFYTTTLPCLAVSTDYYTEAKHLRLESQSEMTSKVWTVHTSLQIHIKNNLTVTKFALASECEFPLARKGDGNFFLKKSNNFSSKDK
jgi:hypothetical protein